jgi:hypothetical protein
VQVRFNDFSIAPYLKCWRSLLIFFFEKDIFCACKFNTFVYIKFFLFSLYPGEINLMKSQKIWNVAFITLFLLASNSAGQVLFESTCQSLTDWEYLDMEGDGQFRMVEDMSVPPGYGPQVIEMYGKNVVLLSKAGKLENGTTLALWKDMEPQKNDADGIMLFRADLPKDISRIHNVKTTFAQYWIEQDFDSGTSIRYKDENTSDRNIALLAGKGLTYDTEWNPTGWFWQKVQLEGENIKVKFWSATDSEPKEWALTGKDNSRNSGRFGVRGWSARFRLAYFKASREDIQTVPATVSLFTPELEIFSNKTPDFKLFLNAGENYKKLNIRFAITQSGKKLYSKEWAQPSMKSFHFVSKEHSALEKSDIQINFPEIKKQVPFLVHVEVANLDGEILGRDFKKLIIRSNETQIEKINQLTVLIEKQLEKAKVEKNNRDKVSALAARDLLKLANERTESGQIDNADKDIAYAEQLLVDRYEHPHGIQHPGNFSLRFKKVELSSSSFTMGNTYKANILWELKGQSIKSDLSFRFDVCNQYGISVHSVESNPKKSTSSWGIGEHEQIVHFEIPSQLTSIVPKQPLPKVFTDDYFLCVTVSDSNKEKSYPWMLLDNPETIRFFRLGQKYVLAPVYITFEPVEISDINLDKASVLGPSNIQIKLAHHNSRYSKLRCAIQAETKAGTILFQNNKIVDVSRKSQISVNFKWRPEYAGPAKINVHIFDGDRLLTKAVKDVEILGPEGVCFNIVRNNSIIKKRPFQTRLNINLDLPLEHSIKDITVSVRNEKEQLGSKKISVKNGQNSLSTELAVQPYWGYYIVECKFSTKTKSFFLQKKIVATVVETLDGKIYANGESFLMKGVNVHGLYGNSTEISSRAMEIMKDYGYNTMRGDHPNLWLLDLAQKKNMVWMALNEFSCASTDEIFDRFDSVPLRGVQEISRQFIFAYRDHAAMLFWNSCNEVGNDLDEFLLTLYPCFKVHDPYNRPVNYANLYGQDNWRGQDIMGINYYFDRGTQAADRQPIILKSVELGKKHNLPMIYTEFNSFQGCGEGPGLESIRDMGEWGLKVGMSGGTFYKLTDVPPIHPGLLDSRSRLEIHKPIGEQIKAYHADATVKLVSKDKNNIVIEIQNKRDFYLRELNIELFSGEDKVLSEELENIPPNEKKQFVLKSPTKNIKRINEFNGVLNFVTHFGLENRVDVRLFVAD